jgi:hypothetical protein
VIHAAAGRTAPGDTESTRCPTEEGRYRVVYLLHPRRRANQRAPGVTGPGAGAASESAAPATPAAEGEGGTMALGELEPDDIPGCCCGCFVFLISLAAGVCVLAALVKLFLYIVRL